METQQKKYSLGMKQRLGIAQAIMEKPSVVVLDEPTNGLDKQGVKGVRNGRWPHPACGRKNRTVLIGQRMEAGRVSIFLWRWKGSGH
nr:ATP-binding cassette domain-containing protein [Salibacterium qingdaonense]